MEGVLPEVIPYLIKRLDQLYGVNAVPLPIPSDDGGVYSGPRPTYLGQPLPICHRFAR
jgi:hypothetical protein